MAGVGEAKYEDRVCRMSCLEVLHQSLVSSEVWWRRFGSVDVVFAENGGCQIRHGMRMHARA